MKPLRRFLRRLTAWAVTQRDEERLRSEIEEHIAMQTAENLRAGLAPAEARREAVLKFGGIEAVKESYREQRSLPAMETLIQDARHALRRLRLAPGFTAATILTLALGIGATTSIFTLVHAVLLKSLPVANPDELYRVGKEWRCCYTGGYSQDKEFSLFSYDLYRYLHEHAEGFSELAAFPASEPGFGVRRAGSSEAAQAYGGEFVSGNYFRTFGIAAYAGRAFTDEDDRRGAPPVAVMSFRLWRERYGSDPSVVGGVFLINDKSVTIVGVAPPGFFGDALRPNPPDFFLPLNTELLVETDADLDKYDVHWLELMGRIRPGVAPAAAEAELRVALKQWLRAHWDRMSAGDRAKFPAQTLFLTPGGAGTSAMRDQYRQWLEILMAVTGLVLLIVCANVANLMLVRGMERRRQIALSMALGARPARLVRQPFLESVLLSLAGGAAGLAIAFWTTRLILRLVFPGIPGLPGVPISASPSMPVLLFAFVMSLATGVAFGIAPAWMATRVDPIEALRGTGRSTARAGVLPRKMLIVLQTALSLVLLSAAGLLSAAFDRLATQDFGFVQDRRIVASFNARLAGYRTDQLPLLYRRIHDTVAGVPGVASTAMCLYAPMKGGAWGAEVRIEGQPSGVNQNFAGFDRVSAGFLEVTGNPILLGRGITDHDTAGSRKIAVINEAFARKFFGKENPLGKRFRHNAGGGDFVEIVGVAKDARYLPIHMDLPIDPFFFLAAEQADYSERNRGSLFLNDIVILTVPGAVVSDAAVRQAMASVDPNLPVIRIRSLRDQVAGQFTQPLLIARITSFFGILSLALASIGLYGVTAYSAGRRANEIGVRMALGAGRGDVVRLVLRGAFGLILVGLAVGLPLTFAAGRWLGSQLFGMSPYRPEVLIAAVVALGVSALAASLAPALRASRVSPVDALRVE